MSEEGTRGVALAVFGRHAQSEGRPTEFELLGLKWDLLDGVFVPVFTSSTELYTSWLPYPVGGSFLEVGSGAGVTSVLAALHGAQVTALDISAAAVANTARNAERHVVSDRVRVLQSDMFQALESDARFDLIFWNSSYADVPADFVYESDLQHAFFDAGYRSHRTYLIEGPAHLKEGGHLLLGFGSVGNRSLLQQIAAGARLVVKDLRSESRTTSAGTMEYQLLELVRC